MKPDGAAISIGSIYWYAAFLYNVSLFTKFIKYIS